MVYLKFLYAASAIGAVLAVVAVILEAQDTTPDNRSPEVEREKRLRLLL